MDKNQAALSQQYLVRYGWQRDICTVALDANYNIANEALLSKRGQRVVIDCGRGKEVGECLGRSTTAIPACGAIYRLMAPEDELLMGHLSHLAQLAYGRCVSWLEEAGLPHVLLEVEPLIDGKTLLFHFLDDPDELVQHHVDHLAALYEQEVRQSEFAQIVEAGCGPDCGTAKSSCSRSCSNCSTGCGVKKLLSQTS